MFEWLTVLWTSGTGLTIYSEPIDEGDDHIYVNMPDSSPMAVSGWLRIWGDSVVIFKPVGTDGLADIT